MNFSIKNILLLLSIALWSCEVIPETDRLEYVEPTVGEKRVLLVDFTGFKCLNCPLAAEKATELHSAYPDNLVVVAMHPATNSYTNSPVAVYDYTCPEADEYYLFVGGTKSTGFPIGVIDFSKKDNTYFCDFRLWDAPVKQQFTLLTEAKINLSYELDAAARAVHISTAAYALQNKNVKVQSIIWLTESHIVGAQVMPDGSENYAYEHNHMLRAAINGTWGESMELGANGTIETRTYSYTVPEKYNINNCSLVAVMLNEATKEVIDVTEIKF